MSIANRVKSLGARATMSDDDVRALLEKDHVEAKTLARQMCEAGTARRAVLLGKLKPILTAHSRAEERAVYDQLLLVREAEEPRTLGNEGYVEHSLVDGLLAKLAVMDAATDAWLAHAKVLKELLEHHIAEEESDVFAELGEYFSREQLAAMGVRFQRDKDAILAGEARAQRSVASRTRRAPPTARKTASKRTEPAKTTRRARGAKTRKVAARKSARTKR